MRSYKPPNGVQETSIFRGFLSFRWHTFAYLEVRNIKGYSIILIINTIFILNKPCCCKLFKISTLKSFTKRGVPVLRKSKIDLFSLRKTEI